MPIYFNIEKIKIKKIHFSVIEKWVHTVIENHYCQTGNISFIFCDDTYLLEINKNYLSHNYYTDVITFDYSEEKIISGDIFISVDRVKENAEEYKTLFEEELHRVIIHGILHLLGFKDKTEEEEKEMRKKEEVYLRLMFEQD